MKSFLSEDGLSEVIGFILLIGLLVVFLVIYQTYSIPVQGRENEIDHMNDIKDNFAAYKISLDSLWVNEREGTTLGTTFDLGTGGGYSQGGIANLGLLKPLSSGGSVEINQRSEVVTVTAGSNTGVVVTIADYEPGALEYQSDNYYWIDQRYYYQMGGVFLEQDSGSTVRVMPPLTVARYGTGAGYTAKVDCTIIRLNGEQLISGTGPVRIDTNLNSDGISTASYVAISNVTIAVASDDGNTRGMWEGLFRDILARYSIPASWYTLTTDADTVSLEITGNESIGVYADFIRADYTATLQTVATGIE